MKTNTSRLLTAATVVIALPVCAQPREYNFDIQRQPILGALGAFSEQTGLQIGYLQQESSLSVPVGPLVGPFTADKAIGELLQPLGLSFERVNDRTIAIGPPRGTDNVAKTQFEAQGEPKYQTNTAATQNSPPNSNRSASGGAGQQTARDLEEVIVTAQKREEKLQDVPISISVLDGDDLDRSMVEGTTEMLNRVPGVKLTVASIGSPTVSIRGVQTSAGASTAAFYIDSVPFGASRNGRVVNTDVYDMERIEVLRGPQGTLYGANALNGVVRILSRDPVLDRFELKTRAVVSGTAHGGENYRGSMAVNVPLIEDKLAARVVGDYQDLSGWLDKPDQEDANDAQLKNLRFKLGAQPTESLSIVGSAWLSRNEYGAQSIGREDLTNSASDLEPFSVDYEIFGVKVGYDFPGFSMTSSSGYINYSNYSSLTYEPLALNSIQFSKYDLRTLSEELVLNSTGDGAWKWTVGSMYRDNEDRYRRSFDPTRLVVNTTLDYNDLSKSVAVFGEISRYFFDRRLELTAGLRYFRDDYEYEENVSYTGSPATPLVQTSETFDATTPRLVVTWFPAEQLTAYASYSEGFRSGLTQLPETFSRVGDFPPLKSDKLKNYEVGSKGDLWGGVLSYDAAIYYIDWQDAQFTLQVPIFNNGVAPFVSALINAGQISGPGTDLGLTLRPISGLLLGLNYSHNDLRYDSDVISAGIATLKQGSPVGTPRTTYGGFADYAFPLGRLTGRLAASLDYISEGCTRGVSGTVTVNRCGSSVKGTRASLSVEEGNHWSATLFAENLADQNDPLAVTGVADWDQRLRPLTIGLQLEYNY